MRWQIQRTSPEASIGESVSLTHCISCSLDDNTEQQINQSETICFISLSSKSVLAIIIHSVTNTILQTGCCFIWWAHFYLCLIRRSNSQDCLFASAQPEVLCVSPRLSDSHKVIFQSSKFTQTSTWTQKFSVDFSCQKICLCHCDFFVPKVKLIQLQDHKETFS